MNTTTLADHLKAARSKARGACMRRSPEHYRRMQAAGVAAKREKRIEAAKNLHKQLARNKRLAKAQAQ
jgi:hypothetical protein